jgi:hypothetical protein
MGNAKMGGFSSKSRSFPVRSSENAEKSRKIGVEEIAFAKIRAVRGYSLPP